MIAAPAQAQIGDFYDTNFAPLGFNFGDAVRTSGASSTAVGAVHRYSNVITVGGVGIDAIVTTVSLSSNTISSYDPNTNTNVATASDASWFIMNLTGSSGVTGNGLFEFQFVRHSDSVPVTLQNVVVNSFDIDGSGTSNTNQFVEFGGFSTSQLTTDSHLTPSFNAATGLTKFSSDITTNNSQQPGTAAGDRHRVRVTYDELSTFRISMGSIGSGGQFGLQFALGPQWASPVERISPPGIYLGGIGELHRAVTFSGAAVPFADAGGVDISGRLTQTCDDDAGELDCGVGVEGTSITAVSVRIGAAELLDGAAEGLAIDGATAGGAIGLDFTDGASIPDVVLGGAAYQVTAKVAGGAKTLTFKQADTFTLAEAEALLEALQYTNSAATEGNRVFYVTVTDAEFDSPTAMFTVDVPDADGFDAAGSTLAVTSDPVEIVQGEALTITIGGAQNLGGGNFSGSLDVAVDLALLGYDNSGDSVVTVPATFVNGVATVTLLSGGDTALLTPTSGAVTLTAVVGAATPDNFSVTILASGDPTALSNRLDELDALGLNEDDYTAHSWTALLDAAATAQAAVAAVPPLQADLDDALIALNAAYAALVDLTALQDSAAAAQLFDESLYTPGSWTDFAAALIAAQDLLADAENAANDITQGTVDSTRTVLVTEQSNLVLLTAAPATDLTILLDGINDQNLNEADYTAQSWAELETAIAAAESALAASPQMLADLQSSLNTLPIAVDALVDLRDLQAAEVAAMTLDEADYTPETWTVFAAELANAQELLTDAQSPANLIAQSTVNATTTALTTAQANLVLVTAAPAAQLTDLLANLAALDEGDYTAHSWAALQDEITAANAALAADPHVLADLNNALSAVQNAHDELVDLTVLRAAETAAMALAEADYTPESWAPFATELSEAQTLLADATDSANAIAQNDVNAAASELTTAQDNLVLVTAAPAAELTDLLADLDALNLDQADYTAHSWTALQNAVTAAEAALAADPHVLADLQTALNTLPGLLDALVDITALQSATTAALLLDEADYTPESWTDFAAALATAQATLADAANPGNDIAQSAVDTATAALTAAQGNLVSVTVAPAAELTDLLVEIDEDPDLNEADYTAHSWTALEEAIATAEAALAADPHVLADLNDALDALHDALDALVDITALQAAVTSAEELNEAAYTLASWTPFEAALVGAQTLLADALVPESEITQVEVDQATSDLTAAQDDLVLMPSEDNTVISDEQSGGDLSGVITILPTGVLDGGNVTGIINNGGLITGEVDLGPGSVINGGTISGSITGDADSPTEINNAVITTGAALENVVIGSDTTLETGVKIGPNVRFESNDSIPPGLDLTGAFQSLVWQNGDARGVPALDSDVLLVGVNSNWTSIIRGIQLLDEYEPSGNEATQSLINGELVVLTADSRSAVLPVRILMAGPDDEEGTYINEDGDIVFVTSNRRVVVSYPVLGSRETFNQVLETRGMQVNFNSRANLLLWPLVAGPLPLVNEDGKVDPAAGESVGSTYYSGRPQVTAVVTSEEKAEGLHSRPMPGLNNATLASIVFRDEQGRLLEQELVPEPADWLALKETLWNLNGVTDVRIGTDGIISVVLNGNTIRGRVTYAVVRTGVEGDPADGVMLTPAGDVNTDGTSDFMLVFPNGDIQTLLIFP